MSEERPRLSGRRCISHSSFATGRPANFSDAGLCSQVLANFLSLESNRWYHPTSRKWLERSDWRNLCLGPKPTDQVKNEPPPHLETLSMSWGVVDVETSEATQFAADGGHFKSIRGHRYIVSFRAVDAHGVKILTLDGSGIFQCSTDPDKSGIFHTAVNPLPASIPHQQFVENGAAPTLQDLIVVMKPDIGAFDYFRLSGGLHHFQGTSENLEYFADSGLMTFSATATNSRRDKRTASLTTSP